MYKSELNIGLIDLHLHLDGSLSVRTVRQLAQMQGRVLPQDDRELLEQLHTQQGLTQMEVVQAAVDGLDQIRSILGLD